MNKTKTYRMKIMLPVLSDLKKIKKSRRKSGSILFSLLICVCSNVYAQKFPKQELENYFSDIRQNFGNQKDTFPEINPVRKDNSFESGAFQNIQKYRNLTLEFQAKEGIRSDTLFIASNDSLIITDTFFHNGPVVVLGNGILRFKNTYATIVGDVYVWGENAIVTADSSYLYFPQKFFYERSLVVAGQGKVIYKNTTLDHSGLSHNVAVSDSARVEMYNVTNIGFSTWGLFGKPEIYIDEVNEAGEFVIVDHSELTFKNAHTILLWHQFPDKAVINWSFPKGDTVETYRFDNSIPGVNGVNYTIQADSCYNILWGMMPANGSDVTISDSKLRAVGFWFTGSDTVDVNGLVNNSNYTNYIVNLTDRNFHLIQSSVQTWSIYTMENANVNVSGCIAGEIGAMNGSKVFCQSIYVDGSGGYWWATDNTLMISGYSTAVNDIRSSKNGIFLFAYSTLNSGVASALNNSIFMFVQSQLPDEPVLYDGSCVWNAYLGKPASACVDTVVPVYGSAWIDKTATSFLMDFAYYSLYFQKSGETVWHPIALAVDKEKRNETLGIWDTKGLLPGSYTLKLILCDNSPDSNTVEALKTINLQPAFFPVQESVSSVFYSDIYPNPVSHHATIIFYLPCTSDITLTIMDVSGKILKELSGQFDKGENRITIDDLNVSTGIYYYRIQTPNFTETEKFVKSNL